MENIIQTISEATGIPIALIENDRVLCEFGTFSPNPAAIVLEGLEIKQEGAYFTVSPNYLFYGYIRFGEKTIMMGPSLYYNCSHQQARSILQILNQSLSRERELLHWFRDMPPCSSKRFENAIILLNNYITGKEIDSINLIPYSPPESAKVLNDIKSPFTHHLDDALERRVLTAVETGNVNEMEKLIYPNGYKSNDFAHLSENAVRSFKITFIVSASLISRAAIKGGLDYSTAITLFDEYLIRLESLSNYQEIQSYIQQMFMDFTRRTKKARSVTSDSAVVTRICRYILGHLDEKIQLSEIADYMNMNSSYLCRHFKQKTGNTISFFITQSKLNEAKHLLENTSLPLSMISSNLGFSDQHYFHTVFKKNTGTTPNEYRKQMMGLIK